MASATDQGELLKGIKVEREHKETFEKLAKGEIDVNDAIKETAEEHINENPRYYDDLSKMENKSGPIQTKSDLFFKGLKQDGNWYYFDQYRKFYKWFVVTKDQLKDQNIANLLHSPVQTKSLVNGQEALLIAVSNKETADGIDLKFSELTEVVNNQKQIMNNSDLEILQIYKPLSKSEALVNYTAVLELLSNPPTQLTDAQRLQLEKYEGRGNQYSSGKIDEGLVHQFYTPYVLVKKAYDLAFKYGFTGGNICEPSCGTGRFFKFAPQGSILTGFDLDASNIEIAKFLYPNATFYQQEFETAFMEPPLYRRARKKSWLPEQDLVIGNPPYGNLAGFYKTYMPKVYSRFEFLFIRLGLEVLKPGGLLIFVVSQNFMNNGGTYSKMKEDILKIGTFVDAIRLPGKIFSGTDISTDLIIFRRK